MSPSPTVGDIAADAFNACLAGEVRRGEASTYRRSTATWPPMPTVILPATKGRPVEFVAPVVAIQEQVAGNARHIVVPDSGHYIHVDRPDLVARLVRDIALSYVDTRDDGAGGTRVDAPSGGGIG